MVRNLKLSDRFRFLWGNKNRSHGPLVNSVIHLICWHIWVCVDRIPLLLFYDVQLEVRFLRPFYGPWPCSCVSGWQPWDVCTPSIFLSTLPTYQSTFNQPWAVRPNDPRPRSGRAHWQSSQIFCQTYFCQRTAIHSWPRVPWSQELL